MDAPTGEGKDEDTCSIDSGVSLPVEKECPFSVNNKSTSASNAIDEQQPHSVVIHNRVVSLKESLGSSTFFTNPHHVSSSSFTPVPHASSCNGEDNSTSDYESTCSDSSFNIRHLVTSPRVLSPDCHVTPAAVYPKDIAEFDYDDSSDVSVDAYRSDSEVVNSLSGLGRSGENSSSSISATPKQSCGVSLSGHISGGMAAENCSYLIRKHQPTSSTLNSGATVQSINTADSFRRWRKSTSESGSSGVGGIGANGRGFSRVNRSGSFCSSGLFANNNVTDRNGGSGVPEGSCAGILNPQLSSSSSGSSLLLPRSTGAVRAGASAAELTSSVDAAMSSQSSDTKWSSVSGEDFRSNSGADAYDSEDNSSSSLRNQLERSTSLPLSLHVATGFEAATPNQFSPNGISNSLISSVLPMGGGSSIVSPHDFNRTRRASNSSRCSASSPRPPSRIDQIKIEEANSIERDTLFERDVTLSSSLASSWEDLHLAESHTNTELFSPFPTKRLHSANTTSLGISSTPSPGSTSSVLQSSRNTQLPVMISHSNPNPAHSSSDSQSPQTSLPTSPLPATSGVPAASNLDTTPTVSNGGSLTFTSSRVTEPITISCAPVFPTSLCPLVCSPSPTRASKQCYSPSLQMPVNVNAACPSPTGRRTFIRRSQSPVTMNLLRPSSLTLKRRASDIDAAVEHQTPNKKHHWSANNATFPVPPSFTSIANISDTLISPDSPPFNSPVRANSPFLSPLISAGTVNTTIQDTQQLANEQLGSKHEEKMIVSDSNDDWSAAEATKTVPSEVDKE